MTLHDAARCGDAGTIRELVDEGAPAEARDDEGRTPLLAAAEAGQLAAVRALVEAGAEVDTPALPVGEDSNDPPSAPILPVVCRRGLIDRVWPLLYGQATVRQRRKGNPDGPTPLMTAAAAGHEAIVGWLLEVGAEVDRRDRDGFTALAYAAAFGHERVVRDLIRSGAEFDAVDHYDLRPVGLAALLGHAGAARALAEAGADLTAAREFHAFSPLHAAARYGHADAVRVLLDAGADTEAKAYNSTPLEMAIDHGHAAIVALLAAGGTDTEAEDWRRLMPLVRAVAKGDRAALGSLLAAGADPNREVSRREKDGPFAKQALPGGATALHLAACRDEPGFVIDLLAAGADPRAQDSLGFTPQALALLSGHAEAARRLRAAAPPAKDEEPSLRSHELVAAVRRGDEPAVRDLLAAGADPGTVIPDTFKYHYLLRCDERDEFFDPSTNRGPGTFGDAGRSVLALAIEQGHDAIARALMAAGAPPGGTGGGGWRDEPAKVPLNAAARGGRRDVVAALLAAGADPNALDREQRTPLFHAAGAGHDAIVRDLIAAGASVDVKDSARGTPLREAAAGGHAGCVVALLEAGATPRPHDLTAAALGGHVDAVRLLLDALPAHGAGPEPHALSVAVWSGSAELVRFLLDAGFDPNACDEQGTPVLATASYRAPALVPLLLEAGADPDAADHKGTSPIAYMVHFGGPAVMRLLLDAGASPEGRIGGQTKAPTPLIRLAGNDLTRMFGWHKDPEVLVRARARDLEMVRILLDHGADVEARDYADGRTALMHAAETGNDDILRALLDAGAEVDATDEWSSRTALHWAAQGGRAGPAGLLLAAGADPLVEDGDGLTPEDVARRAGHDGLARDLREKAGDRPRRGPSAAGALRAAVEAGHAPAVRAALEAGADVSMRFAGGKTPVLLAAERGSAAATEALLAAGANPNVHDASDATPLLHAIETGRVEVVRLLLRAGADPNAGGRMHRGDEPQLPLHFAIAEACRADLVHLDPEEDKSEGHGGLARVAIVRALIEANAAVDREDAIGCRPLWYALDMGEPDLAALLVEAGAGKDAISAAYLKARTFVKAARAPEFREHVAALAERCGAEPRPWTARPTRRDFRRCRHSDDFPTGPIIGAQLPTTRALVEELLAEHESWRLRGAFLVRTARYGGHFDVERQTLGLLPTDDPCAVIAAACSPGTDWGWICPGFYIRDLKALERDYPFTLIGCEPQSLELQFTAPVADPVDLARRLRSVLTHLGGPGLSESPDEEEVSEYLAASSRIDFSWE